MIWSIYPRPYFKVHIVSMYGCVICPQEPGEKGQPGDSVFGPPGLPGAQGPDGRTVSRKKILFSVM